jgi:hypothetical protein
MIAYDNTLREEYQFNLSGANGVWQRYQQLLARHNEARSCSVQIRLRGKGRRRFAVGKEDDKSAHIPQLGTIHRISSNAARGRNFARCDHWCLRGVPALYGQQQPGSESHASQEAARAPFLTTRPAPRCSSRTYFEDLLFGNCAELLMGAGTGLGGTNASEASPTTCAPGRRSSTWHAAPARANNTSRRFRKSQTRYSQSGQQPQVGS